MYLEIIHDAVFNPTGVNLLRSINKMMYIMIYHVGIWNFG